MNLLKFPFSACTQLFLSLFLISLTLSTSVYAQRTQRGRARACSLNITLPNANIQFRYNYKLMRIYCVPGFTLQGKNVIDCVKGKWNSALPVCARDGCSKLTPPRNGVILGSKLYANLYCKERYKIAGGRVTYCNGTHWDRPLGECRESSKGVELACDFETEDLCGWTRDESHDFDWKRKMAANLFKEIRTGPQHDHTTLTADSGHYMLMESFDQKANSVARFISPVYSQNITFPSACFQFYYFMYGATVGTLNVYVKPLSIDMDEIVRSSIYQYFTLSGDQQNIWKKAMFTIEEISEDFQIIIEGLTGSNHLSDIAIDDILLMPSSKCNSDYSMLSTNVPEYTEYAIYDVQSCEGRCSETNSSGYGVKNIDGKLYKECDCHPECDELQTCCPNYQSVCIIEKFFSSTELSDVAINVGTFETTKAEVITTTPTAPQTLPDRTTTIRPTTNTNLKTTNIFSTTTTRSTTTTTTTKTEMNTVKETTPLRSTHFIARNEITVMASTNGEVESGTTSNFMATSPTTAPPVTLKSSTTTERTKLDLKEKVITWQVNHSVGKTKNQMFIYSVTFAVVITICILIFLHYRDRLRHFRIRRYSSDRYSEATTLTYNQDNDLIIEN